MSRAAKSNNFQVTAYGCIGAKLLWSKGLNSGTFRSEFPLWYCKPEPQKQAKAMTSGRESRTQVAVALGLVYLFWGSTYLGIRLAITYIPPELMTGIRFSVAGAFMLAYCGLTGRGIRMNAGRFWRMAVIGILLLSISNVILAWAEETVPSGL